jgi:hypothetical protein
VDSAPAPPGEAVNRPADAVPGGGEPFPTDGNDPPSCRAAGNIVPTPAEGPDVVAPVDGAGAVPRTVVVILGSVVPTGNGVVAFGTVVVIFGTVVVIFGTVVVIFGTVVVTFGTVVVTFGTVVVTFGTVVVTFGTVVVTLGTVVLTGSVVVIVGSVVLTGSVVVIVGSAGLMVSAGAADLPATAVLATTPRRRQAVKAAARLTA